MKRVLVIAILSVLLLLNVMPGNAVRIHPSHWAVKSPEYVEGHVFGWPLPFYPAYTMNYLEVGPVTYDAKPEVKSSLALLDLLVCVMIAALVIAVVRPKKIVPAQPYKKEDVFGESI